PPISTLFPYTTLFRSDELCVPRPYLTCSTTMPSISREMLDAYLDDALSDPDTARLETALRQSDHLRKQLRNVIQERDRGEHSLRSEEHTSELQSPYDL